MARRRVTEPPPATPPKVPARLAEGPYVEDWVTDDDEPPPYTDPDDPWWPLLLARRRHREAVTEWAVDHDLSSAEVAELVRFGAPRYRRINPNPKESPT